MAVFFCVFVAGVIPTQKEKTQEGHKLYRLWFVLDSTRSVYFAFCRCQGEADQGCRHLGATLFELDVFLSNQSLSPLCLHIGTPCQHLHINLSLHFQKLFDEKEKKNNII